MVCHRGYLYIVAPAEIIIATEIAINVPIIVRQSRRRADKAITAGAASYPMPQAMAWKAPQSLPNSGVELVQGESSRDRLGLASIAIPGLNA